MHTRTLIAAAVIAAAGLIAPATAQGEATPKVAVPTSTPEWADYESATVHPGVWTASPSGECTANFVFHDATDIYIGSAAHCTGTESVTSSSGSGCEDGSHPIGTEVEVDGADHPATLVYSSWLTMQAVGESDENACNFNDFALLRLDPRDHAKVNPTIPFWYGPDGTGSSTPPGTQVYAFGNSFLRLGLSPMTGFALADEGDGWAHRVYFVTPGIPGDSGSAVIDEDGLAVGVISTVIIAPYTGANDAVDVRRALDYMKAKTNTHDDVALATGTQAFQPLF
jgi:S1-C subfamily serine protease